MYKKAFHFHNSDPARFLWHGPRRSGIKGFAVSRIGSTERVAWFRLRAFRIAVHAMQIRDESLVCSLRDLQACLWLIYREWEYFGVGDYRGRITDSELCLLLEGVRVLGLRTGDHPRCVAKIQREWTHRFNRLRALTNSKPVLRRVPHLSIESADASSARDVTAVAGGMFVCGYCCNRLRLEIREKHFRRCKAKKRSERAP